MPPNHDNTERQNRTLCDGYQRAQRDHVHVAGKVQDEKIKHVQGRAENDGIICVFGQSHGTECWETQNIARQNHDDNRQHGAQNRCGIAIAGAEYNGQQRAGENSDDCTANDNAP